MNDDQAPTLAYDLRDARLGCLVLSAHAAQVGALFAAAASDTQANIRRALGGLRKLRAARMTATGNGALEEIERSLMACSSIMQEHDVIRQYQGVVADAIERLSGQLEKIAAERAGGAGSGVGGAPEAFLDMLWQSYVSDDQRALHRRLVRPGESDPPRLPRTEIF